MLRFVTFFIGRIYLIVAKHGTFSAIPLDFVDNEADFLPIARRKCPEQTGSPRRKSAGILLTQI
jgi:hypothetical protein